MRGGRRIGIADGGDAVQPIVSEGGLDLSRIIQIGYQSTGVVDHLARLGIVARHIVAGGPGRALFDLPFVRQARE